MLRFRLSLLRHLPLAVPVVLLFVAGVARVKLLTLLRIVGRADGPYIVASVSGRRLIAD